MRDRAILPGKVGDNLAGRGVQQFGVTQGVKRDARWRRLCHGGIEKLCPGAHRIMPSFITGQFRPQQRLKTLAVFVPAGQQVAEFIQALPLDAVER